ncbi:uncharacterized protein PV09_05549 [Verruconis gallopava]|uniref:Alpha-taxilin n=1 Tax=Verruconis gallopava TaxID=253628 RepID=A0A0D2AVZ9_9PEZI|nr:uncharacterized protein PV09_05549 [Verruconis gallopava]KIW03339.1 hypothetical protein PV09_05549 [Verruconis gallopava]
MANNAAVSAGKKTKNKKLDAIDNNKLIEQTMARLERDMQGDREQEQEIEREVKRAMRDLDKSMSGADPMHKIEQLQKKCTALYADMKRQERELQKQKKRADALQKEKDNAKSELSKATSMRDKLEKLSRETNNENRKLRADVQRLQDVEAKMREELHERLESMVLDVEDVINSSERAEQQSETFETDELFKRKFRSFIDQYEMRELQFTSLMRQKDLEIQAQLLMLEQQRKAQEMESSKSHQLTRQVSTFSQTETELRSQLNIYVEKFKQVEDTLNNSNDLFLTFRREMEEMSKKTKRLEKENLTLSRKHEATNQNILKMAEERTRTLKELELLRKKNENLEKLCRGMQAQGRGQVQPLPPLEQGDQDDGTESEYEEEYEDEDSGEEYEDDDDTEDERLLEAHAAATKKPFGPVPPPSTPTSNMSNGAPAVNGRKGSGHMTGQQQMNGIRA